MKTTKEKIAIMQAYEDGKKIEICGKTEKVWHNAISPDWNWAACDYRIKQEPEYVPFTFEDAEHLIGKVIKSKDENWIELLTFFGEDYTSNITYEALLRDYTFLDGSPCGKLKQ